MGSLALRSGRLARSQATSLTLYPAVPANLWLRSADPAVESHRLRDFDLPSPEGGMQPPIVYAGRRWDFSGTRFERDESGSETRWLLFLDRGLADHDARE